VATKARYAATAATALWLLAGAARAAVEVSDPWARATMPGQKVAGVYMQLKADRPSRLIGVRSRAAKTAEVHEMSHAGGVMKMRKVEALELPANRSVRLEPGGYHVMLFDIAKPLAPGERVQLTLIVEQAGKHLEVQVDAKVRPLLEDGEHDNH
jgi:copper(I)-binding protein